MAMLIFVLHKVATKHPVNFFDIKKDGNYIKIKSAGYRLDIPDELDETTELGKFDICIKDRIWLIIDDYGDKFVGTFIYPDER